MVDWTDKKKKMKENTESIDLPLRVFDRMGGSPFFCRSFSRSLARLSLE